MDGDVLVQLTTLADRLPFVMDEDDEREAEHALETLSDDARYYGSQDWKTTAETPYVVQNLVLRAAQRHMKNYEGYTQSRAGDETVTWSDRGHESGSAYFTKSEQKRLATYANKPVIYSVQVEAWGTKPAPEGFVPVAGEGKQFPLYKSDTSPW